MTDHSPASVYDFAVRTLDGEECPISKFAGNVLLIVNVASRCGFTPQYEGLETLRRSYHAAGFEVLGFPCNQFGGQEPGNASEIRSFCTTNYQVSFPLFAKINVNGAETEPLYAYLKSCSPGVLGTEAIKWNFTKFLVDRRGQVVDRFAPTTSPENLIPAIERLLNPTA